MAVLSAACTFGAERGMLPSNPCRDVRGVRAPRKARPVALGAAELEFLAEALPAGRDRTLALVLALAGVRPGEALALRWSDVGDQTISVTKSLAFGEEKATKTRRDRAVPVSPELRRHWTRGAPRPRARSRPSSCSRAVTAGRGGTRTGATGGAACSSGGRAGGAPDQAPLRPSAHGREPVALGGARRPRGAVDGPLPLGAARHVQPRGAKQKLCDIRLRLSSAAFHLEQEVAALQWHGDRVALARQFEPRDFVADAACDPSQQASVANTRGPYAPVDRPGVRDMTAAPT